GMLEKQGLLLNPWEFSATQPRRTVRDAATGEPLGFVSRRPSTRWRWLRWLERPVWEVYETEDASLLMSLRGPGIWTRTWEVFDAEPRLVGTLRGTALLDGYGGRLAVAQRSHERGAGRFVNPHGLELASFSRHDRDTLLTFHPALEGDPFAKMI